MKLVLIATGLFVALLGVGIACGPKEKFCYQEGKPCEVVKAENEHQEAQVDIDDSGEVGMTCIDQVTGKIIPCDGGT
jgi:hypothetical protein